MNIYEFILGHKNDAVDEQYEQLCEEAAAFIEEVYEIAFGDDAVNRDYSVEEVLERLREFSDKSLEYEESVE